jgi:hypothetical protein
MSKVHEHNNALRQLLAFTGGFLALLLLPYLLPAAQVVRPWLPGEPVPLVHIALNDRKVIETADGNLIVQQEEGADLLPPGTQDGDTAATAIEPEAFDPAEFSAAAPAAVESAPAVAEVEPTPEEEPPVPAAAPAAPQAAPINLAALHEALPALKPPPAAAPASTAAAEVSPTVLAALSEAPAAPKEPEPIALEGLPVRAPARPTPLEVPAGGLDAWFTALARAQANEPGHIAKAAHWGDSTIAADGLTKTVRKRLTARFGDGGPGFLPVKVDPRWNARPGITRSATGDWKVRNITFGGAPTPYYGLAGIVATAYGQATSVLSGGRKGEARQLLHRFELYYQAQPGGGTVYLKPRDVEGVSLPTLAEEVHDAFYAMTVPQGAESVTITTGGEGPVTLYGIVMETQGPGVVWDSFGVAGASTRSMNRQGRGHAIRQIRRRAPDLIVYQMGGNELGYPSLKGNGKVWRERYVEVVQRLRAGAPDASCLLVTPLDQGERVRGEVHSKPTLNNMIRLQREVARELGCAFWDARAAMGGPGSFGTWMAKKLAWSDLYHLTGKGLALVGNTLADAMEVAYDDWRRRNPVVAADTAGPGRG